MRTDSDKHPLLTFEYLHQTILNPVLRKYDRIVETSFETKVNEQDKDFILIVCDGLIMRANKRSCLLVHDRHNRLYQSCITDFPFSNFSKALLMRTIELKVWLLNQKMALKNGMLIEMNCMNTRLAHKDVYVLKFRYFTHLT